MKTGPAPVNRIAVTAAAALLLAAPAAATTTVDIVNLVTNDLVYDPVSDMLYASVPSSVGLGGNTITPINPYTGAIGAPVFIGSEPSQLAIGDDGQYLYAEIIDGDASGSSTCRR